MNQYEAMFLFDPTFGSSFEKCEAEIHRLMERAEAELLFCRKWDERRLAFRVKGRKRGIYALAYFKSLPEKIVGLERDVKLSEDVLRVLVLRAEGITPEIMERQCAATSAPAEKPAGKREGTERKDDKPAAEVTSAPIDDVAEETSEVPASVAEEDDDVVAESESPVAE
ncbi:MAG: 30S ribosomal protein S6 [Planctomycetes bacterium]|nr:30S ribosomal protein S6 [Planctomycetota bacterium]